MTRFLLLGLAFLLAGCSCPPPIGRPNDGRIDSLRSNYIERVRCDDFYWEGNVDDGWGRIECQLNDELIRIVCNDGFKTYTNKHHGQDVICNHDGDTHLFYRMPKETVPPPGWDKP